MGLCSVGRIEMSNVAGLAVKCGVGGVGGVDDGWVAVLLEE